MILAIEPMSATLRMIFYGVAVLLFLLASIGYSRGKVSFLGAGAAAFAFVSFWNALAAT
jgi:hypothetical protein